ncbi:hypothetical protein [Streptomyces sp. PTY087I2]|uniref:hypothetical protein n=1 Tax=Streptomyces sp. PTY087I2 TaxID=1819298 RepID=UPI0021000F7D|nr:hypothetical protein [Streptomyces sp. PTY087I2]
MPSTVLRDHQHPGSARTPALDGNDLLAGARPAEFEELFSTVLTGDFGAVARLHQMLETASDWCREHGVRDSAAELDILAERLAGLGEELHLVQDGLSHEIRSHPAAAAAGTSPSVSARHVAAGPPTAASAPPPPGPVGAQPRSR